MARRALVLGGGGIAGIAWELGVLSGLAEGGVAVSNADLVVGTSAGAAVASQLFGGVSLEELYQRQLAPLKELVVAIDVEQLFAGIAAALAGATSEQEARARIGAFALVTPTVSEEERRAVIAWRLPSHAWPEREMILVAVDAQSGEPRFFDRHGNVDLVDAVAASCAVPGVWPPVTIEGRRYIDGGVRTMTNADLARGSERILVIAPMQDIPSPWHPPLEGQIAALHPARTHLLLPDDASTAAFGKNPLDPTTAAPSARAGRAQGLGASAAVRAIWAGD